MIMGASAVIMLVAEPPPRLTACIIADEAYLRESILEPRAKVPDGYARGIHPSDYRVRLNDQQVDFIIAFIISLANE